MSDNFKETVNLKDRMKKATRRKPIAQESRAQEIDKLYEEEKVKKKSEFKRITQPQKKEESTNLYKGLFFILLLVFLLFAYFTMFKNSEKSEEESITYQEKWYSIELKNSEVFYGKIGDLKNDPLEIKNVYYNYNQTNKEEDISTNLRLVKRGKETYGPDGSMIVYSSNVNKIEPLSEISKVLTAILANEK